MKPATFLGITAVSAALGSLVTGHMVLAGLSDHTGVLDANLAKAVAAPLHHRLAEIVLAGHLIVAAVARSWIGPRWATTLGLVLIGASAAHRFWILPTLYTAWSRADLVAGRPVEHVLAAKHAELLEHGLVAGMVLVQLGLLAAHVWAAPRRAAPQQREAPPLGHPLPSAG